ncbi:tetratricopeptide repeat protein [Agrilutibacter solisilvae]|uniref:Tetratricopeptide repeat protein n=1 Tax=Agrilutibacter solisilvae TaxID=2763317 RepID=A0A974Y0B8_9GAMM|nr:tetratricopeptide repeat protein [Lysobacter solisilvae]QSX78974.1 tetratricopeptide repeat protein [Lysobacter solisilvae]
MPFLGIGLHMAIALYFATHAIRSGQERYWLMILFAFPGLGSLVYALTIWLPSMRHSRQGRQVVQGVRKVLDPMRELRLAQDDFDGAATTGHRLRLADALIDAGRASEAVVHYQESLRGIHAQDPDIQVRLARALLESGHATAARELLDEVIARRPDYRSQEGHVTYARAAAAEGNRAKAREEFDALLEYANGFDAHAYYAPLLVTWGDQARALAVCEQVLARVKRMPGYARGLHKAEIAQLRKLHAELTRA